MSTVQTVCNCGNPQLPLHFPCDCLFLMNKHSCSQLLYIITHIYNTYIIIAVTISFVTLLHMLQLLLFIRQYKYHCVPTVLLLLVDNSVFEPLTSRTCRNRSVLSLVSWFLCDLRQTAAGFRSLLCSGKGYCKFIIRIHIFFDKHQIEEKI